MHLKLQKQFEPCENHHLHCLLKETELQVKT